MTDTELRCPARWLGDATREQLLAAFDTLARGES
jgi:hypothetical protein